MKMKFLAIAIAAALQGQSPAASPIGDAAALMKPNSFRPLSTVDALTQFRFGDLLEPIFAFSNGGAWDPATNQMLMVGAPHGTSMHFIRCPESDLSWRRDSMPPGNWSGAHTYDHLTCDTSGIFYHLYWADGVTSRYNTRTGAWITPLSSTASGFGTLDFIPELNALARVVAGGVYLYRLNAGVWQTVQTGLSMGGLHNLAAYSSTGKFLLFGGGDGSSALYKMDTSLTIKTLKPAPFQFGVNNTLMTGDPASGTIIVARPDSFYKYDAADDSWKGLIKNPIYNMDANHSGFIPINTYGVIAYLSVSSYPALLYKYADASAIESRAGGRAEMLAGLVITPNPFKDRIRIAGGKGVAKLSIYAIDGKRVHTANLPAAGLLWDAAGLPSGVYTVKVTAGKESQVRRIFLQR